MENMTIDPLAGLSADLPQETARDHAAALVKGGGVTVEQANASLAARGAAPLTANSREFAEASRAALLNDSAFVARYSQGDPEAIAKLFQADLRVQQSSGKLTDRAMAPTDYNLNVAQHMPNAPAHEVLQYGETLSVLAAKLDMPPAIAQAFTDGHMAAAKFQATALPDEREAYGDRQTTDLHSVLGADAEAKLKQASDILSRAGQRQLNLAAIARSNGAEVALMLYHQAQALAARK